MILITRPGVRGAPSPVRGAKAEALDRPAAALRRRCAACERGSGVCAVRSDANTLDRTIVPLVWGFVSTSKGDLSRPTRIGSRPVKPRTASLPTTGNNSLLGASALLAAVPGLGRLMSTANRRGPGRAGPGSV
jgi:hypothetical protein